MATPHTLQSPETSPPPSSMPGDPKRAQRIAELLMDDARLVTDVRGMLGFTGTVNGRPLSVMGSGMGQPSFTIYATELFSQFGVERIIRVGTAGALSPKVKVGDVIVATGAHTDSSMNQLRIPGVNFSAVADSGWPRPRTRPRSPRVLRLKEQSTWALSMSRDHFYFTPQGQTEALARYGVLGVEMEAAALYGVAAEYDKQALAILTVSDHLLDHSGDMSAAERETRFTDSLRLAVAAAHS